MNKVLIAGAGHGGLTAAITLARNGLDVTLYEKSTRDSLGHDWHDTMMPAAFDFCGIPRPEGLFTPYVKARHMNPKKTVVLETDPAPVKNVAYIDRKDLIRYLLQEAENAGVNLCFETEVLAPVCDGKRITGLELRTAAGEREEAADLVIDAAGMDSPVRRNLPEGCGIPKTISESDTYFVARMYYNAENGAKPERPYTICFFHNGAPGLDWVIDRPPYADLLVGSIGSVNEAAVKTAVDDFRKTYPFIGETLLRGSEEIRKIPLRRTLPLFVADGYAAVGDAAAMTEPMNGSGITLSMKAGKILADTVLAGGADAENLWRYQYAYQKALGEKYLTDDIVKGMLGMLTPADMDYLFEKRVLTAREMLKDKSKVGPSYFLHKAALFGRPSLLKPAAITLERLLKKNAVCRAMPRRFDSAAIAAWAAAYEAL